MISQSFNITTFIKQPVITPYSTRVINTFHTDTRVGVPAVFTPSVNYRGFSVLWLYAGFVRVYFTRLLKIGRQKTAGVRYSEGAGFLRVFI